MFTCSVVYAHSPTTRSLIGCLHFQDVICLVSSRCFDVTENSEDHLLLPVSDTAPVG